GFFFQPVATPVRNQGQPFLLYDQTRSLARQPLPRGLLSANDPSTRAVYSGGAVSGGNELSNSSSRSRRSLRVTDSLARPNRRANQRPITSNPRPDYPRIVPHSLILNPNSP